MDNGPQLMKSGLLKLEYLESVIAKFKTEGSEFRKQLTPEQVNALYGSVVVDDL